MSSWVQLMKNYDFKGKREVFPPFYSKLFTKNCGEQGDCLFYCLKTAFQLYNPYILSDKFNKTVNMQRLSMATMRSWLSFYVTLETIKYFLLVTLQDVLLTRPDSYSAMQFVPLIGFSSLDDFEANIKSGEQLSRLISFKKWSIHDVAYVRNLIQSSGYKYQGTDLSLFFFRNLLKQHFEVNLGFAVFGNTPETVIMIGDPTTSHFMLLYNQGNYHWLLVSVQINEKRYDSIVSREILTQWFPKGQLISRPILF